MKTQVDIGEKLFLKGMTEESEKIFQELLKSNPSNPDVLNNLGILYESKGKLLSAEKMYAEAIAADELNIIALTNLANLYQKNGLWEKAALQFERCIILQPEDSTCYNSLAVAQINIGNFLKARRTLEKSIQLLPDQEEVIQLLDCLDKEDNKKLVSKKNGDSSVNESRQRLNILFVQEVPCIRNYKMAVALISRGHRVSLAYSKAPLSKVYPGLSDDIYDSCFQLQSIRQLWDISENYDVIHCHNEPDTLTVVALSGEAPVVHDTHDLISLRDPKDGQLRFFEGLANRGASGRVYSTTEQLNTAFNLYGVKGPSIVLNNNVSKADLPQKFKKKLSDKDGEIHLVYEGGIGGNTHRDFLDLFSELSCHGINIHIYPNFFNPDLSNIFSKYNKIHYYHPVSPKMIIETMTQYDCGIIPFNLKKGNKTFLDTTIANKLFEYLAAGLPVLASSLKTYEKYFLNNRVGTTFSSTEDIVNSIPKLMGIARNTDVKQYVRTYEDEIYQIEKLYFEIIKKYSILKTELRPLEDPIKNKEITTIRNLNSDSNENRSSVDVKDSQFYDELYKSGGWLKQYHGHYSERLDYPLWKKCVAWLSEIENPEILEIACGCGQFANMLFDYGYVNYNGFDLSPVAIKMAKQMNPDHAEKFFVDETLKTDLLDEEYNTIIIFEALEHIQEDLNVLSRIVSGSAVFLSVPNYSSASHVRWFSSEREIYERYDKILNIREVVQIEIGTKGNVIYLIHAFKI